MSKAVRASVLFSVATNFGAMAIGFASAAVISRILHPSEIGLFVVCAAAVALLESVRGMGMDQYLVQALEVDTKTLGTVSGFGLVSSLVVCILLWSSAGVMATAYGTPGAAKVLHILAVSFVFSPLSVPALAMLQRQLRFKALMVARLTSALASAIVAIGLAVAGFGVSSMAWGVIAARASDTFLMMVIPSTVKFVSPSFSKWREILTYGSKSVVARVANTAGLNIAELAIGRLLGLSDAAFYNRGSQLTLLYRRGIEAAIGPVAMSTFAQRAREGEDLRQTYLSGLSLIAVVAWPAFGFLAIFAAPAIRLIYGPGWEASAPVAQVLSLAGAVYVLSSMSGPLLAALGAVGALAKRELYIQPVRIALVIGACPFGTIAVACSLLAVFALSFVVNQSAVRRSIGATYWDHVTAIRTSLAVSAFSIAAMVLSERLLDGLSPIPELTIGFCCGALGWLVGVFVFRHPVKDEIAFYQGSR